MHPLDLALRKVLTGPVFGCSVHKIVGRGAPFSGSIGILEGTMACTHEQMAQLMSQDVCASPQCHEDSFALTRHACMGPRRHRLPMNMGIVETGNPVRGNLGRASIQPEDFQGLPGQFPFVRSRDHRVSPHGKCSPPDTFSTGLSIFEPNRTDLVLHQRTGRPAPMNQPALKEFVGNAQRQKPHAFIPCRFGVGWIFRLAASER